MNVQVHLSSRGSRTDMYLFSWTWPTRSTGKLRRKYSFNFHEKRKMRRFLRAAAPFCPHLFSIFCMSALLSNIMVFSPCSAHHWRLSFPFKSGYGLLIFERFRYEMKTSIVQVEIATCHRSSINGSSPQISRPTPKDECWLQQSQFPHRKLLKRRFLQILEDICPEMVLPVSLRDF